jgi:hypothetical protein
MKRTYQNVGWRTLEDGRIFIYELDWDHIYKRLDPKAQNNKSQQTTMGPLRIRIVDKAAFKQHYGKGGQ